MVVVGFLLLVVIGVGFFKVIVLVEDVLVDEWIVLVVIVVMVVVFVVVVNVGKCSGEELFNFVCVVCYGVGVMGVFKVYDVVVWLVCFGGNLKVLVESVVKGKNVMLFKGGVVDVIEEEFFKVIVFMMK